MVLFKEEDIAINLFKDLKIEQGSKLRAENELPLKFKKGFITNGNINGGKKNGNKNKKK